MEISNSFKGYMDELLESDKTYDLHKLIIYLVYDNPEKTNYHIRKALDIGYRIRSSRTGEKPDKDISLLVQRGKLQINHAIYLRFLHKEPEKVIELFEWAAENCMISEEDFRGMMKYECYDDLSRAYFWRSYALVCLGKYSEALDLLINIVPFSNKWKQMTGDIYWLIEYGLTKTLISLCKFKINPTKQNLIDTQKGIKDYIKSLKIPKVKLEGYLYYFHLKEQFADVYNADPKDYPDVTEQTGEIKVLTAQFASPDEEQTVWIWDVVSIVVGEEFGTDNELKEYVAYVSKLDDFPSLSSLFDLYMTWGEIDAESLYNESKRLLEVLDINQRIIEKTRIIFELSRYSVEKGSGRLVLKPEDLE